LAHFLPNFWKNLENGLLLRKSEKILTLSGKKRKSRGLGGGNVPVFHEKNRKLRQKRRLVNSASELKAAVFEDTFLQGG